MPFILHSRGRMDQRREGEGEDELSSLLLLSRRQITFASAQASAAFTYAYVTTYYVAR